MLRSHESAARHAGVEAKTRKSAGQKRAAGAAADKRPPRKRGKAQPAALPEPVLEEPSTSLAAVPQAIQPVRVCNIFAACRLCPSGCPSGCCRLDLLSCDQACSSEAWTVAGNHVVQAAQQPDSTRYKRPEGASRLDLSRLWTPASGVPTAHADQLRPSGRVTCQKVAADQHIRHRCSMTSAQLGTCSPRARSAKHHVCVRRCCRHPSQSGSPWSC